MKYIFSAAFISIGLFAITNLANAQTTAEQNTLLPEINPQDIEIRSEYKVRFPGLRRQPILGFNPRPRVFSIDPGRMPFMETKEQIVANVPVSQLGRPEPPARDGLSIPSRNKGYARAGFGSFSSPEVEAYASHIINDRSLVSGAVDFRSSDGHLDSQPSSFRFFNLQGEYLNKLKPNLLASVRAGFNSDFNYINSFFIDGTNISLQKEYTGVDLSASLKSIQNQYAGWESRINVNYNNIDLGSSVASDEVTGDLSFKKYWAGTRLFETWSVEGHIRGGDYSQDFGASESWVDIGGAVNYGRVLNYNTRIQLKGGLQYISDGVDNSIYPVADASISHNFQEKIAASASVYARPSFKNLLAQNRRNLFLQQTNTLQSNYTLGMNAEVAATALRGNKIYGGTTFEFIKDYTVFRREIIGDPVPLAENFFNLSFEDAYILRIYGGISQQLVPEKFWFNAEAYAQVPELDNGGTIPFQETVGFTGTISYKPTPRILLESWADVVGSRENPGTRPDLDGFALVNAKAEMEIGKGFGVYLKALNILDESYEIWSGYRERSAQIFGGLTYKF